MEYMEKSILFFLILKRKDNQTIVLPNTCRMLAAQAVQMD
jgi:hypothetical protein